MTLKEARQTLEIEESWRGLVFFWDPGKCAGNEKLHKKVEEKTKKINEAYEGV